MRIKRYYAVVPPRNGKVHRADKRGDGEKTTCGLRQKAGWFWYTVGPDFRPRCSRCYR